MLKTPLKSAAWLFAFLFALTTAHAQSDVPIGELFPLDTGAAQPAQPVGSGMPVASGSELAAGVAPARFRLNRGGQVRICPRSTLSVNSGSFGLMLGMGAGNVELDYRVPVRGSDILLTPDFSLQLLGPGVFHFALGVDKKGDTCFKSLPGNLSQIVVSELLGTGTYKTKAGEAVSFSGGKLNAPAKLTSDCGCPPASTPTILASSQPPTPASTPAPVSSPTPAPQPAATPAKPVAPAANIAATRVPVGAPATPNPERPMPEQKPGQVQVEVEAPFIYSARAADVQPYSVAKVSFSSLPNTLIPQEVEDPLVLNPEPQPSATVQPIAAATPPQPAPAKKKSKGFFGRVKGFFGSIFRH